MPDAVWVYAVTSEHVSLEGMRGVAGEVVRELEIDGLVAIVGSVPLTDFDEVSLKQNLEDLDWLTATARAHDAVLRRLPSPIVPFRLATVYSDEATAKTTLTERLLDLAKAIEFVRDRTELGVIGFSARNVEPKTKPTGQSGRDYLMSRKRELEESESADTAAARSAALVHDALSQIAVASRSKRPQDPALTKGEPMVHNGTYLIDDARIAEFEECVEACRKRFGNLRLLVNGPWPPYSFVNS